MAGRRGDSRTAHAHPDSEDQDRVERDVHNVRAQRCPQRRAAVTHAVARLCQCHGSQREGRCQVAHRQVLCSALPCFRARRQARNQRNDGPAGCDRREAQRQRQHESRRDVRG